MEKEQLRVLVVAGSARKETNCPAADGKSSYLVRRAKDILPAEWTVDILNLSNDFVLPKIQSCNACVSTSMALCVWPCNCYRRHSFFEPDLMWDEDAYGRLYAADAILIIAPVNWYGPTSNLKLFFDRLVCANGGNPDETLIDHKDGLLAANLENSPEWQELTKNHLEGRTAGFFVYGDMGGDEINADGRPRILEHVDYFADSEEEKRISPPRESYLPLVWQCRYSGIEVPENLIQETSFGGGLKYNQNQIKELQNNAGILEEFDRWVARAAQYIARKGKVPPSKYPIPLRKPDSALHPLVRQLQLLMRSVLGGLWQHTVGYFTSRRAAKKWRLNRRR